MIRQLRNFFANTLLQSAWKTVLKPRVREWLRSRVFVLGKDERKKLAEKLNLDENVLLAVEMVIRQRLIKEFDERL